MRMGHQEGLCSALHHLGTVLALLENPPHHLQTQGSHVTPGQGLTQREPTTGVRWMGRSIAELAAASPAHLAFENEPSSRNSPLEARLRRW